MGHPSTSALRVMVPALHSIRHTRRKTLRAPGSFFTRSLGATYELHVSRNNPANVQQFALGCYEERRHSSHNDCRPARVWTLAYRLHAAGTGVATRTPVVALVLMPWPRGAVALAEDPPFGGLWCDQPAPFSTLSYLPASASRLTMGTNVLKSNGLGTCRSNPASMAASISLLEA